MSDLLSRALQLNYEHARRYVETRGWVASRSNRDEVAVFHRGDGELVLPVDSSLRDYGAAMLRFAQEIADEETRPLDAVLSDLGAVDRDRHRPALVGTGFESGAGLEAAETLIEGATRALRSAACSAVSRRAFHPRLSNGETDAFIAASRFAGTERGSFVAVIETPTEVDGARPGFGRDASVELFRSLQHLVSSLRRDQPEEITAPSATQPQVSANLCEALLQMAPSSEGADLRFEVTWSPLVPVPARVPTRVQIDRHLYERIQLLAARMRPSTTLAGRRYAGTVRELKGSPGESGRVEGPVVLELLADEGSVRARAHLDADHYQVALEAHASGSPVLVMGELHRATRSYELRNVRALQAAG